MIWCFLQGRKENTNYWTVMANPKVASMWMRLDAIPSCGRELLTINRLPKRVTCSSIMEIAEWVLKSIWPFLIKRVRGMKINLYLWAAFLGGIPFSIVLWKTFVIRRTYMVFQLIIKVFEIFLRL